MQEQQHGALQARTTRCERLFSAVTGCRQRQIALLGQEMSRILERYQGRGGYGVISIDGRQATQHQQEDKTWSMEPHL